MCTLQKRNGHRRRQGRGRACFRMGLDVIAAGAGLAGLPAGEERETVLDGTGHEIVDEDFQAAVADESFDDGRE